VLRGRDGRGQGYDNNGGWRMDKRKIVEYNSDVDPYGSPPSQRRHGRRSPAGKVNEDSYTRIGRHQRAHEDPGPSKVHRQRSRTLDAYYRESRGGSRHSAQRRGNEDAHDRQYSWNSEDSPKRRSPVFGDHRVRLQCPKRSPSRAEAEQVTVKGGIRKREKVIKPIEVDAMGIPVGTMKDQFNKDINSFIKEMNPCVGYEKQKQKAKDRLQERIYAEYEVHGEANRVDEKYIKKCGTKALITWRHMLNKAVDMGDKKPPELNMKFWEELRRIKESEESKKKSAQMDNQARNRGLRNSTKDKIRQAATVKLLSGFRTA
jgi:hypothetical protein